MANFGSVAVSALYAKCLMAWVFEFKNDIIVYDGKIKPSYLKFYYVFTASFLLEQTMSSIICSSTKADSL